MDFGVRSGTNCLHPQNEIIVVGLPRLVSDLDLRTPEAIYAGFSEKGQNRS